MAILELREGGGLHGLFFGNHATPLPVIREEMKETGYVQSRTFDYLERQHFLLYSLP